MRLKEILGGLAIFALVISVLIYGALCASIHNAEAAVSLYNVAQGVETDLTHWLGGIDSRGILSPKLQTGTVTFDNSYPRGGETLDLSGTFSHAVLFCILASTEAYTVDSETDYAFTFEYKHAASSAPATGVVQVYNSDGHEIADGADLAGVVTEFFAIGW